MSESIPLKEAEIIYDDDNREKIKKNGSHFFMNSPKIKMMKMSPLVAVLVVPVALIMILVFILLFSVIIIPFLIKNRRQLKAQGKAFRNLIHIMRGRR